MLNGLDLFSGIGGNTLGLQGYVKTIAYCEADRHAQSVLLSRMGDSSIEIAPIWDNICTLKGDMFDVPVDIIMGGFPCQDISVAGHGIGLDGKRSGLFYEIIRLAKEIKPTFLFLENVPAIRTRGLDRVIEEFTEIGYDCRWCMLSAQDVGANHKRERWFLLAKSISSNGGDRSTNGNSNNQKQRTSQARGASLQSEDQQACTNNAQQGGTSMANTNETSESGLSSRAESQYSSVRTSRKPILESEWWETEPDVGRVVNGIPLRVERLKRLGNAVVPLQAKIAFETLMGLR